MPKAYIHLSFLIFNLSFFLFAPAFAQTTFDPLAIGVGARALGMGKAYVAVAEDGDIIFSNPAGLGEIDDFKFTSMSATVLEEVNYTMLGGVYPLGEKTAIGIGYVAAGVSGIEIRDAIGNLLSRSDYLNSVFIASFGKKLAKKFSLGVNFKYFYRSGSELEDSDGSGINFDVGFLQKGLDWLALGMVGQNILRSGKIKYKDSEAELPFTIKIGSRMHLFGEEFESAIISPVKVMATADVKLDLRGTNPTTTHLGIEVSPIRYLTFRTGLDQDPIPGGIRSYLTYGVSLKLAGIGFHYAYHPYTEFSENSTHYFSLAFDERGWPYEGLPDIFLGKAESRN